MKRLCAALLTLPLCAVTGCSLTAAPRPEQIEYIRIDPAASPAIRKTDGYCWLRDDLAKQLQMQILLPKSLGQYDTYDDTVRMCDPSGQTRVTLEYRSGDDVQRCYTEYCHDVGCRLPANRMQTYEIQSIGSGEYPAYRLDARETEENEAERMISYWFINRPSVSGKRRGCYIITFDTTAENLESVLCCISGFSTLEDFTPPGKEETLP